MYTPIEQQWQCPVFVVKYEKHNTNSHASHSGIWWKIKQNHMQVNFFDLTLIWLKIWICSKWALTQLSILCPLSHFYLRQGEYVFGNVCLFVCLSVSNITRYAQNYERIVMDFYGRVLDGKKKKWLNSGGDPEQYADCSIGIRPLLNKLRADFDETFRIALQWY